MGSAISGLFGLGGDLANIGMQANDIGQTEAGIQQDTNASNKAYGAQTGGLNSILNTALGPGGLSSLIGAASGPGGTTSQLSNWNGLKPAELASLQTSLGNNTNSMMNSFKSELGGVANPAMALQRLGAQSDQSNLQLTSSLGAAAQSQELGATEAAGGLQASLASLLGSLGTNATSQFGGQGRDFMGAASGLAKNLQQEQDNLSQSVSGAANEAGSIFNPLGSKGTPTGGGSTADSTAGMGGSDLASLLGAGMIAM